MSLEVRRYRDQTELAKDNTVMLAARGELSPLGKGNCGLLHAISFVSRLNCHVRGQSCARAGSNDPDLTP